eukprot:gnl/Chilomastix_cuspidata/1611.p1 GENE.gnl/Chilomastix_cuspidata/1611~~gnl/Chilomastix_cuspidata/1611.p1  ORF type:complete len:1179 (+),score=560.03 gnl/Chilomastix_cuspidata/1611:2036-5572(+)
MEVHRFRALAQNLFGADKDACTEARCTVEEFLSAPSRTILLTIRQVLQKCADPFSLMLISKLVNWLWIDNKVQAPEQINFAQNAADELFTYLFKPTPEEQGSGGLSAHTIIASALSRLIICNWDIPAFKNFVTRTVGFLTTTPALACSALRLLKIMCEDVSSRAGGVSRALVSSFKDSALHAILSSVYSALHRAIESGDDLGDELRLELISLALEIIPECLQFGGALDSNGERTFTLPPRWLEEIFFPGDDPTHGVGVIFDLFELLAPYPDVQHFTLQTIAAFTHMRPDRTDMDKYIVNRDSILARMAQILSAWRGDEDRRAAAAVYRILAAVPTPFCTTDDFMNLFSLEEFLLAAETFTAAEFASPRASWEARTIILHFWGKLAKVCGDFSKILERRVSHFGAAQTKETAALENCKGAIGVISRLFPDLLAASVDSLVQCREEQRETLATGADVAEYLHTTAEPLISAVSTTLMALLDNRARAEQFFADMSTSMFAILDGRSAAGADLSGPALRLGFMCQVLSNVLQCSALFREEVPYGSAPLYAMPFVILQELLRAPGAFVSAEDGFADPSYSFLFRAAVRCLDATVESLAYIPSNCRHVAAELFTDAPWPLRRVDGEVPILSLPWDRGSAAPDTGPDSVVKRFQHNFIEFLFRSLFDLFALGPAEPRFRGAVTVSLLKLSKHDIPGVLLKIPHVTELLDTNLAELLAQVHNGSDQKSVVHIHQFITNLQIQHRGGAGLANHLLLFHKEAATLHTLGAAQFEMDENLRRAAFLMSGLTGVGKACVKPLHSLSFTKLLVTDLPALTKLLDAFTRGLAGRSMLCVEGLVTTLQMMVEVASSNFISVLTMQGGGQEFFVQLWRGIVFVLKGAAEGIRQAISDVFTADDILAFMHINGRSPNEDEKRRARDANRAFAPFAKVVKHLLRLLSRFSLIRGVAPDAAAFDAVLLSVLGMATLIPPCVAFGMPKLGELLVLFYNTVAKRSPLVLARIDAATFRFLYTQVLEGLFSAVDTSRLAAEFFAHAASFLVHNREVATLGAEEGFLLFLAEPEAVAASHRDEVLHLHRLFEGAEPSVLSTLFEITRAVFLDVTNVSFFTLISAVLPLVVLVGADVFLAEIERRLADAYPPEITRAVLEVFRARFGGATLDPDSLTRAIREAAEIRVTVLALVQAAPRATQ